MGFLVPAMHFRPNKAHCETPVSFALGARTPYIRAESRKGQ